MTHNAILTVSPAEQSNIKERLETGGLMSENETIVYVVHFIDGFEMDIKVCGGNDDPAWTEAILYDADGRQVAYSDPSDELVGDWDLKDNDGDIYAVTVL